MYGKHEIKIDKTGKEYYMNIIINIIVYKQPIIAI